MPKDATPELAFKQNLIHSGARSPHGAGSGEVSKPAVSGYTAAMHRTARRYTALPAALIALGLGVMAATAAFAGWLEHGSAIFLSLAESGMSWCF